MSQRTMALWMVGVIAACNTVPPAPEAVDAEAHRSSVEQWRQWRHEELSKPDGWLSLVDLRWLEPGDVRFGSHPEADFRIPTAGVPDWLVTFIVTEERVDFAAEPGVEIGSEGEKVTHMVLWTPEIDESPVLSSGTLRWHVIRRGERLGVRLKDSASPVLVGFEGIENYPITLTWRLDGRFEAYDPPRIIKIPNVLGVLNDTESPGAAVFEIGVDTYRIDLWKDSDDDLDFFTAFGDTTNNDTSYGGGRFLRIDPPDEHGRIVVDFNRAYNPPCVFTPFSTCPLPPEQNRLPVRVEAGEKTFKSAA